MRIPRPDRGATTRGAARLEVILLLAVALTFAAAAVVTVVDPGDEASDPAEQLAATVACLPKPGRPGPLIDLGIDPDSDRVDELLRRAGDAGAEVISTTADWSELQPQANGPYRWGPLRGLVERARKDYLQLRVQLVGMPGWAQDPPTGPRGRAPRTPAELQRWTGFVRDFMEQITQVTYVEVWNEPNTEAAWPSGPDPVEFARLLRRTSDVVESINPGVTVVSGSLSGNDVGFLQGVYDALDRDAGAVRPFDMVGVHPFAGDLAPGAVPRVDDDGPFGEVAVGYAGFRRLHQVMAEHGDGDLPVSIGAFGYSTRAHDGVGAVPDTRRARYLTEALRVATCSPYVDLFSWYALAPGPGVDPSWTLVDADLEPGRTYAALREWGALVVDAGP